MLLRCTGGHCAERQCDCSRSYFPDRHLKPRPILRMCTQSLCPTSWNRRHNHSRCGIMVREGAPGDRISYQGADIAAAAIRSDLVNFASNLGTSGSFCSARELENGEESC